jgi:hypothetical protein
MEVDVADWVKCRSVMDANTVIWVNLEQVVCMMPVSFGTEITYAGTDCTFVVNERPADILGNNKVRDA